MGRVNSKENVAHEKEAAHSAGSFQLKEKDNRTQHLESDYHFLGTGKICNTGARGHATPQGRSSREIVLDASEGFIPLWEKNTTLRWRFRERSLDHFKNPVAAMKEVRNLFADALIEWGDASPVKFSEDKDVWDFEVVMKQSDDCTPNGCVLAEAFFPDSGRHELVLYPRMFTQTRKEQVDTFIHEIGHIFGLRHFFADIHERAFPSVIYGRRSEFTIMNYGVLSELTDADREDLRQLYQMAWSGALTEINGTPVRFVKPYHTLLLASDSVFALHKLLATLQPESLAYQPRNKKL